MQIIIYDETQDYEVDKLMLSDYDIINDPETLIDLLRDIIEEYEGESDQV